MGFDFYPSKFGQYILSSSSMFCHTSSSLYYFFLYSPLNYWAYEFTPHKINCKTKSTFLFQEYYAELPFNFGDVSLSYKIIYSWSFTLLISKRIWLEIPQLSLLKQFVLQISFTMYNLQNVKFLKVFIIYNSFLVNKLKALNKLSCT